MRNANIERGELHTVQTLQTLAQQLDGVAQLLVDLDARMTSGQAL